MEPTLHGVNPSIDGGEIHAIMDPNGLGKSTTAYALVSHPKYRITEGQVFPDGEKVTNMTPDERVRAGLLLAMQYPVEVSGVSITNFLRMAKTAVGGEAPKLRERTKRACEATKAPKVSPDFVKRDLNVGFSGGEKKHMEILQMELLEPKVATLDETDSGLDVDVLHVVSKDTNRAHERTSSSIPLITHYSRVLRYVGPSFAHVSTEDETILTGGSELADELEKRGYDEYIEV